MYRVIQIKDSIGNIFDLDQGWEFNNYKITSAGVVLNINIPVEELVLRFTNGYEDLNKIKFGRYLGHEYDLCRTFEVRFSRYEITSTDNSKYEVTLFFNVLKIIHE